MDSKPVHKYSRGKHGWLYLQYVAKQLLKVPVLGLATFGYLLSGLGFSLSGLGILVGVVAILSSADMGMGILSVSFCGLFMSWCIYEASKTGMQSVLEPILPPEENSALPDKELLVRASAPNAETQRAELLRASTDTQETPPEQLLRATSGTGE